MVTIKEIAEMCDVSVSTVSNILNGKSKASPETTKKVMDMVKKTGYKPNLMARGLRRHKTNTIALIVDDIAQFTSPPIVESVMEYCEEMGYRTVMRNLRLYSRWQDTWYNQEEMLRSIVDPVLQDSISAQVDGVIYIAGHGRKVQCFGENFPIPAVIAYAFSDSTRVPSVVIDDPQSAQEVVMDLLDKGHRHIACIAGRPDNFHTQQRLLGYQKALFEYGIPYDPSLVFYGDWVRETGYEGAKELIKRNVTAFFCIADQMAGGVYDYLHENGYTIGEDISVAGFDDQDIAAYFTPALTTTKLPLTRIGRKAAKILIDKLETGESEYFEVGQEPVVISIPCTFVERKSVSVIK